MSGDAVLHVRRRSLVWSNTSRLRCVPTESGFSWYEPREFILSDVLTHASAAQLSAVRKLSAGRMVVLVIDRVDPYTKSSVQDKYDVVYPIAKPEVIAHTVDNRS